MFLKTLTENRQLFVDAFWMTIKLSALSAVLCLFFGTIIAAMRVSPVPILRAVGTTYVNLLRNTPLTLVFVFTFFGFPKLGFGFSPFKIAVIALTAYTSAFVAEVIRSGINTVHQGQAEAARALGMTFGQTLRIVILPQAVRSVIPPLVSTIIAMVRNSTIAAGFSVAEAGRIRAYLTEPDPVTHVTYDQLYILLWVAIIFIIVQLPLLASQQYMEKRWRLSR